MSRANQALAVALGVGVPGALALFFASVTVAVADARTNGPAWITWALRVGLVSITGSMAVSFGQFALQVLRPPAAPPVPAPLLQLCPACGEDRADATCPACGFTADPAVWFRATREQGCGVLLAGVGFGVVCLGLAILGLPFAEALPSGSTIVAAFAMGGLFLLLGGAMLGGVTLSLRDARRARGAWHYEAELLDADLLVQADLGADGWHASGALERLRELPEPPPAGDGEPSVLARALALLDEARLLQLAECHSQRWVRAPGRAPERSASTDFPLHGGPREPNPALRPVHRLVGRHLRWRERRPPTLATLAEALSADPDAPAVLAATSTLPLDAPTRARAHQLDALLPPSNPPTPTR